MPFIQNNAGRAFEHMVEMVDEARAKDGLPGIIANPSSPHSGSVKLEVGERTVDSPGIHVARRWYPSPMQDGCLPLKRPRETTCTFSLCPFPPQLPLPSSLVMALVDPFMLTPSILRVRIPQTSRGVAISPACPGT